jgi:hypothetical protein
MKRRIAGHDSIVRVQEFPVVHPPELALSTLTAKTLGRFSFADLEGRLATRLAMFRAAKISHVAKGRFVPYYAAARW